MDCYCRLVDPAGAWQALCSQHPELASDMISAIRLAKGGDMAAVLPRSVDECWVVVLRTSLPSPLLEIAIRPRARPSVDYAFLDGSARQRVCFTQSSHAFIDWLGPDNVLFDATVDSVPSLTLRVAPDCLWFLRFPLVILAALRIGPLARYQSVEHIVTALTFTRYYERRNDLCAALDDPCRFVQGTAIVINTYEAHRNDLRCAAATRILVEILSYLRDIDFGNGSLRWLVNPTVEQLRALITDRSVRWLFADFESSKGYWETGDGESLSWDRPDGPWPKHESQPVVLDSSWELSHLELMRVFHCNSVFDPFCADSTDPADAGSIVRKLLDAGARTVEGGMTEETFLDFVRALKPFLCAPVLQDLWGYSARALGRNPDRLVEEIEQLTSTIPDASTVRREEP
jgi:hypothetical protein